MNDKLIENLKNIFGVEDFSKLTLAEIFAFFKAFDFSASMIKEDFTRKKIGLIHHQPFKMKVDKYQDIIDTVLHENNDIDGLLTRMEKKIEEDDYGRVAVIPRKISTSEGKKTTLQLATPQIVKWNNFTRQLQKLRVAYSMFSGTFRYIIIEDFELNKPIRYEVERIGETGAGEKISVEQFEIETKKSLNYRPYQVIKKIPAVIFTNFKTDGVESKPSLDRGIPGIEITLNILNLLYATLFYEAINGHSKIIANGNPAAQYQNLLNDKMFAGQGLEIVSQITGIDLEKTVLKPATFDSQIFYGIIDKLERYIYEVQGFAKDIANDSGAQKNDLEHKYNRRSLIVNIKNMILARTRKMKELAQLIVLMHTGKIIKLADSSPNFKEQPLQSLSEIGDFATKAGIPIKVGDSFLLELMGLNEEEAENQIKLFEEKYGTKLAPANNQEKPQQQPNNKE